MGKGRAEVLHGGCMSTNNSREDSRGISDENHDGS